MVNAYTSKEYTYVPWKQSVYLLPAYLFYLSIDLIPDFIPIAGIIDDVASLHGYMTQSEDIDNFLEWEKTN